MKAIILAAGIGSRLFSITKYLPKPLIEIGGKSVLEHTLDRVTECGVDKIVLATGHLEEKIKEKIGESYNSVPVKYITNTDYAKTNNIYSLWLAKEEIDDDIVIINGDNMFNKNILKNLLEHECRSGACVDLSPEIRPDAMRVTIEENRLKAIGKEVHIDNTHGDAIGIYKFSKDDAKTFFKIIEKMVLAGDTLVFYLKAMDKIMDTVHIHPVPLNNLSWFEIDDHNDLNNAPIILENIFEEEKNNK